MIYMQTYKKEGNSNKETPSLGSVFSLSSLGKKDVSVRDFLSEAEGKIREILVSRFPNQTPKQDIHEKPGRLNFACPYCGDSHSDSWKKRGNLYYEGFNYHCFNCGQHAEYEDFLKHFDKEVNPNHVGFLKEQHDKAKENLGPRGSLDPYLFLGGDHVEKWAVNREVLIKKMGFTEARGSRIEVYLKKRLQMNMNLFAWNEKAQKLLIFNTTADGKKVLGFQIRNFKDQPKYLTFKLNRIYEEILNKEVPQDETFEYANEISTVFNIMKIDINKPITGFEGPLDAFLFDNGVGLCSVKNEFPFDIPIRWFYDMDKAGKEAALKRVSEGQSVFMWKKFLKESNSTINTIKKVDLTDIMVYSVRKKEPLKRFSNYFTKTKYDVYGV